MMALIKKNMVLIGVLVVVAGLLYYFFMSSGSGELLTSSQDSELPVSQEILATLGNLRTIKLDNSIFSDPLFISLSDFGVSIPPAAAGRRNPFAPVGQNGPTPTQTASSTQRTASTTPAQ